MNSMEAKRVMNGKYADLYIDGDLMAEATAFKAEVTLTKEEVKMLRHVGKGYKVTGYDCKGQLKLHKVSSYMTKKMNDNIKAGKQTVLDDKDAIGSERIVIKDATFDSLILADWEVDKMGEESYSFTFSDWDLLDLA